MFRLDVEKILKHCKMSLPFRFFSRGFTTSNQLRSVIKNVTVIGGGLMGSGIAQVAAQNGNEVALVEVNDAALQKAKSGIKTSVQRVAKKQFKDNPSESEKFVSNVFEKLKFTLDLPGSVKNADLVIEAIVENIEIKHKLFSQIDTVASSKTIFASNTSSLSIRDIASVTSRKDRFIGLHFFNPVPVMKLLEVIQTSETSNDTYKKAMEWGKTIGKVTITCKDTPGFVVNRLLIPFISEAFKMLERGDATAKDIDTAMKLGAGHPMGPFELADYVGHDTTYFILKGWAEKYPNVDQFKATKTLKKLVEEGKLGVKTGEGIYSYKK